MAIPAPQADRTDRYGLPTHGAEAVSSWRVYRPEERSMRQPGVPWQESPAAPIRKIPVDRQDHRCLR
jgi:hypothetical protein